MMQIRETEQIRFLSFGKVRKRKLIWEMCHCKKYNNYSAVFKKKKELSNFWNAQVTSLKEEKSTYVPLSRSISQDLVGVKKKIQKQLPLQRMFIKNDQKQCRRQSCSFRKPLNCILVKNCTCMWQNILFVPGFHTLYLRSCNVFLSDFFLWLSFLWFQTLIHGILKQKPVSKGAGFSYVFLL